jgi:hypothetical protein
LTPQLRRALLAAGVTALATLAAAPAARAGWMTGNQNPPVYTTDNACHNGMHWTYATFFYPQPPAQPPAISNHTIVIQPIGTPRQDPPDPWAVVSRRGLDPIPLNPITLPSTFTEIHKDLFPLGPLGRRVNEFDYSARFTFAFNRMLGAGTPLRMQWRESRNAFGSTFFAAADYRVAPCWVMILRRPVARPLEMAVPRSPDLAPSTVAAKFIGVRIPHANGYVTARKYYNEDVDGDGDSDVVLVFDGGDQLRCEAGARIVLTGAERPSLAGC